MPEIQINALDGTSFAAYATSGARSHAPGILFIHGANGFDETAQTFCDALASWGCRVVCPFLFRTPLRIAAPDPTSKSAIPFSTLYPGFDLGHAIRTLFATLAHLRRDSQSKTGTVGFCLGGTLAFLLASRSDVDLAVGYDCVGLESFLDEIYDIRIPMLFHVGGENPFVPPAVREKTLKKLAANPALLTQVYASAGHAFIDKKSASYQEEAATQAFEKTRVFFSERLKL